MSTVVVAHTTSAIDSAIDRDFFSSNARRVRTVRTSCSASTPGTSGTRLSTIAFSRSASG